MPLYRCEDRANDDAALVVLGYHVTNRIFCHASVLVDDCATRLRTTKVGEEFANWSSTIAVPSLRLNKKKIVDESCSTQQKKSRAPWARVPSISPRNLSLMAEANSESPPLDAYDAAVDDAIATCDGDLRGALKALIIANEFLERDQQKALASSAAPSIADDGNTACPLGRDFGKLIKLASLTGRQR